MIRLANQGCMLTGKIGAIGLFVCMASTVYAQTAKVDHFTQSQLVAMGDGLRTKAQSGSGSASRNLADYGNHSTMVSLRAKNGGGELHQDFADIFVVLQGHATLVTGGAVQDPKVVSPGEIRGSGVQNGERSMLNAGDIVHIPAGVPHQVLVDDAQGVIYVVVKVKKEQ